MAISPDSQWLATGGSNGTVRIWDAATGQARALMRVDNMTFACAGLAQEDLPWEAGRPVPFRLPVHWFGEWTGARDRYHARD
jgi:WD40 repeat protein